MDKFVIRPVLLLGYCCSLMNFGYIYITDISILTANNALRFTESYAWANGLLLLQMFFETPSVRYCCDIIQYMFLFVSVSVNTSLSPPPQNSKCYAYATKIRQTFRNHIEQEGKYFGGRIHFTKATHCATLIKIT